MNFRLFNIFSIVLVFTLLPAYALGYLGIGWILSWLIFYVLVLFWGAVIPQLAFYLKPIRHGKKGSLCITFDDGPDVDVTPKVLDILKSHGVKATFFCKGHLVDANPHIAKRIVDEGHIIANHTYSHKYAWGWSRYREAVKEIAMGQNAIYHATGKKSLWFRPPFGITNPHIAKAVSALGLSVIAWDLRSLDTLAATTEQVMWRLHPFLKRATILLLHDHLTHTPQVLEEVLAACLAQNIQVVSLEEAIGKPPYVQ